MTGPVRPEMNSMTQPRKGFREGLVIVHTGDGKGKTTAALGLAMRAIGRGMRVCMIQFIKSDEGTGEAVVARRYLPQLTLKTMGCGFVFDEWTPEDIAAAREAWQAACKAVQSDDYDMVILDEVTYVLSACAVTVEELQNLLSRRPKNMTLVFTGRDASEELIEAADLVTVMQCAKHPFEGGVKAQKGIEY